MVDHIVLLCNALAGCLFIILGLPLAKRQVKPNALSGFRVARAFESDGHWYAINAVGGRCLIIAGVVIVPLSVAYWWLVDLDQVGVAMALTSLLPVMLPLAWAVLRTVRYAGSLPSP